MEIDLKKYFAKKEIATREEIVEAIAKDLKDKKNDIVEVYNYYLPFFYSSDSAFTMKNKYTDVRKAIEDSSIAKARKMEILNVFKMHSDLYDYLNSIQTENAKERLNNKIEFSENTYFENMKFIKGLIETKNFDSIRINRQEDSYLLANLSALYFAMATGRRSFEIFKTVDLIKIGKTMYFKGIAKKREECEVDYVALTLDDDYHFLKKCLENIRKYYDVENCDNKKFNGAYSENWNKFAKNILKDKTISYSLIRDMYTNMAIKNLNVNNLDTEIFRKLVLSHADTVMSATDYYRKTKITE